MTTPLVPPRPVADALESDPPIAHHYVFVLLIEGILFLALAWLAAHYR